jgi:hypothetical protein
MTGASLPSDLIAMFREHFSRHEASGVFLSGPAVRALSKILFTIEEVARDFEDDYRLMEKLTTANFKSLNNPSRDELPNANHDGKVVRLKLRPRVPPTSDGGDAA